MFPIMPFGKVRGGEDHCDSRTAMELEGSKKVPTTTSVPADIATGVALSRYVGDEVWDAEALLEKPFVVGQLSTKKLVVEI
jgi:hypothetical protein